MDIISCFKEKQGSIVACVSPLASLMMDQRPINSPQGAMKQEFVGEDQHTDDDDAIKRVLRGKVQLIFINPESLIANVQYRNVTVSLVTPLPGRERGRVWRHCYSKRVLLECNN